MALSSELENIENQSVKILSNILKTSTIVKFIDRDDKSEREIQELIGSYCQMLCMTLGGDPIFFYSIYKFNSFNYLCQPF